MLLTPFTRIASLLDRIWMDARLFWKEDESAPSDTGSSDSNGESENADPTLDPEEEDFGAGLQDDDEDDITLGKVSASLFLVS